MAGMKAFYLVPTRDGGVYEPRTVSRPKPEGPQILVEVKAAGTNRGELLMLPGYNSANPDLKPLPAGIEFAGVVAELGPDATGWHVGERVMGRSMGCYAEYVIAGGVQLMRIPDDMPFEEAAAIPNVFITAHDAVVSNGELHRGESAMITAASSGIGTAAIQLAKLGKADLVVATTRDAQKTDALCALGADLVVDTSRDDWVDIVKRETKDEGIDVVIDSVGGPMLPGILEALAIRGRVVSVGRNGGNVGACDLDQVALKRARIVGTTFRTRSPQESHLCFERFADDCLDAFGDGRLKPILDRAFPFEGLSDAHEYMLGDGQIGKIVVTMNQRPT